MAALWIFVAFGYLLLYAFASMQAQLLDAQTMLLKQLANWHLGIDTGTNETRNAKENNEYDDVLGLGIREAGNPRKAVLWSVASVLRYSLKTECFPVMFGLESWISSRMKVIMQRVLRCLRLTTASGCLDTTGLNKTKYLRIDLVRWADIYGM